MNMTNPESNVINERFRGLDRLYGVGSGLRLAQKHVCVIGVGGVGSWVVEAMARSAVGHLTLIDADDVCVSNTNRQLHALEGQYGRVKVEVMAERAKAIIRTSRLKPSPSSLPHQISNACSIAAMTSLSTVAMHFGSRSR